MDSSTLDYALMAGETYFCKRSSDTQRTRRASVPARLRARGLGACGARLRWRQHRGLRAHSGASANWLRRSDTTTRHVSGLGWVGEVQDQGGEVHSMRVVGTKLLSGRMNVDRTSPLSTEEQSGATA